MLHGAPPKPQSQLCCGDLSPQEDGCLHSSLVRVQKMCGRNDERTGADQVSSLAVNPGLAGRKVGDPPSILQVLSVAEQHHTLDLILHSRTETGDRIRHDRSTLRVTTCSDGRVRAFARGKVEETLSFADGGLRSTGWKSVLCDTGSVGATYALNPDV
jgi:hypothetical protein